MKRKSFVLLLVAPLLASCGDPAPKDYAVNEYEMKEIEAEKVTVSFYYNFNKQEFNLNSGMYATGNSIALKVDQINKGEKVAKPDTDPLRKNYEFNGWHLDSSIESPFDFENTTVNSNLVLYAHWTQTQEEEFIEPEYIAPSKIDDSLEALVSVTGVLNCSIDSNSVKLPNSAIYRLEKDKEDIVNCLNYKIKSDVTLTATYDAVGHSISYNASKGAEKLNGTISVINNSSNLIINNSTYESKAKAYEENGIDFEDHRIMLAGSSSMENWKASTEDMLPLKTYNHGIGGTTVHQWRDSLNQRLVYPYSPKIVVYYVGVNNIINSHDSAEETSNALIQMFDDVHAHLPDTKVYYVLINDLPNYLVYKDEMHKVNDAAIEYASNHDFLTPLDAGRLLLKDNGLPNVAYFLTDGLHMSLAGYALWGNYIKSKLIEDMKK